MTNKELTCIVCPMGCSLHVTLDDDGKFVSVTGNTCPRGAAYAQAETTHPTRTVTTTMRICGEDARVLPVKTDRPISKEKMFDAMRAIAACEARLPVHIGDVLIENLLGECNLVATADME